MKKISQLQFAVPNPEQQVEFYSDYLGMTAYADGLGYAPSRCHLHFKHTDSDVPEPERLDFYWKIGITVANLEAAANDLRRRGWPVGEPAQFRDIGYLCQLRDPAGLTIELLQHSFEGRAKPTPTAGHQIGTQATLAHLTLRCSDIAPGRRFLTETMQMRLMSIQPIPDLDFCLYFFAWDQADLPHTDLHAVENREWLWERPYTLIELQLRQGPGTRITAPAASGFAGMTIEHTDQTPPVNYSVRQLYRALEPQT